MAFLSLIDWWQVIFYVFCLVAFIQLLYYWIIFQRLAYFKPSEKIKSQQHPVSVIVCARDEAANLAKNLPGVLVQTYPTTHEVIVVNHNSQDETRYLLEEFKKTFKNLHIVNLEQEAKGIPGKKYPLSIGIKEAHHEILLLTDADCVPASESWMQKMQDAYGEGTEIVLGYGAYHKQPGVLNKLIRFETFHSALQYLSFALAGMPYMGVGRNLSYKKGLFFANKGFSSINHVLSGDDDLFINRVAKKDNTAIAIDQEAITLSAPKKTFGDWWRQKNRHFTTGKFYKPTHRFLLGLYSLTHFLFYPLLIVSALFYDWRISLGIFLVRCLSQAIIYYKAMNKLHEKDLFAWWWLLDIWMFIYYCIFAPALWKKPRKNWH
ncbi:glycosyltransferase [Pseudoflavitalea sp. X16]|uniref:glycosyltransferase n=1 Tax=Paraflavitalea devenefica TaxID=2716334 RepID=UPI0014238234|nr:glycosyltransferase [Paraflavitalea devenefica]NII23578.1 glycosyltransferase [Paraflavitalea devenefica]